MAEVHNIVVVKFPDASKAYQAMSVLKDCDADGRIGLKSAAVVERTLDGELRIPEDTDNIALVGTVSGSLIGMLIGVLGGPVGVLVGWGAGALMGGTIDIVGITKSEEALTALARAIPPESTAVIASVTEPAVEVIDGEMAKLDGEVTRRPVVEVMDELEAAEEAADAAAREGSAGATQEAQGRAERQPRLTRRVAEGEAPRRLTVGTHRVGARRPRGRRAPRSWTRPAGGRRCRCGRHRISCTSSQITKESDDERCHGADGARHESILISYDDFRAATLMAVGRHAVRRLPPEPNPALVRHGQERAQSVENRIADRIRRSPDRWPSSTSTSPGSAAGSASASRATRTAC